MIGFLDHLPEAKAAELEALESALGEHHDRILAAFERYMLTNRKAFQAVRR